MLVVHQLNQPAVTSVRRSFAQRTSAAWTSGQSGELTETASNSRVMRWRRGQGSCRDTAAILTQRRSGALLCSGAPALERPNDRTGRSYSSLPGP